MCVSTLNDLIVVFLIQYIKLRQKYHRELVGYLNKRAQLGNQSLLTCYVVSCFTVLCFSFPEQKYYSQLGRLVKQSQSAVADLEQHQVLKVYKLTIHKQNNIDIYMYLHVCYS